MSSTTFFFFFIPLLAVILLAINFIFAPHNPYGEKDSVFECGFHSFLGQNRTQFSISFFIFALLFLLFDLEILLVYPYIVSAYTNNVYGLVIMLIFFLVLTLGFAFELGKNALKIDSRQTFTWVKFSNTMVFLPLANFFGSFLVKYFTSIFRLISIISFCFPRIISYCYIILKDILHVFLLYTRVKYPTLHYRISQILVLHELYIYMRLLCRHWKTTASWISLIISVCSIEKTSDIFMIFYPTFEGIISIIDSTLFVLYESLTEIFGCIILFWAETSLTWYIVAFISISSIIITNITRLWETHPIKYRLINIMAIIALCPLIYLKWEYIFRIFQIIFNSLNKITNIFLNGKSYGGFFLNIGGPSGGGPSKGGSWHPGGRGGGSGGGPSGSPAGQAEWKKRKTKKEEEKEAKLLARLREFAGRAGIESEEGRADNMGMDNRTEDFPSTYSNDNFPSTYSNDDNIPSTYSNDNIASTSSNYNIPSTPYKGKGKERMDDNTQRALNKQEMDNIMGIRKRTVYISSDDEDITQLTSFNKGKGKQRMEDIPSTSDENMASTSFNDYIPSTSSNDNIASTSSNANIPSTSSNANIPSTSSDRHIMDDILGINNRTEYIPGTAANRQRMDNVLGIGNRTAYIPGTAANRQRMDNVIGIGNRTAYIPGTAANRQRMDNALGINNRTEYVPAASNDNVTPSAPSAPSTPSTPTTPSK